ncbi:MAG: DUF4263 domain-containing protein [Micavibrio sp.]|nr:DUF4263 domain-containing protein [Micavibrio sp.]
MFPTHRSALLKDIKEIDDEIKTKINQGGNNNLQEEINLLLEHFLYSIKHRNYRSAKRLLSILDYHARNGNDFLATSILDGFYAPLLQTSFKDKVPPIDMIDAVENSLLSCDIVSYREELIGWNGSTSDVVNFKGLNLYVEDAGSGVFWHVHKNHKDKQSGFVKSRSSARRMAEESARKRLGIKRPLFPKLSFSIEDVDFLGLTEINGKIRLISLKSDGTYKLADEDNLLRPSSFCSSSLLLPVYFENKKILNTIEEFEYLINKTDTKEADLQDFFVCHPDFILFDDYKKAHSQIILSSEEFGMDKLIPDFILEPHKPNILSDILEIKLPKAKLVSLRKNRERFSSFVSDACAQLREYSSYFDNPKHRENIKSSFGLHLYQPRLILIIGRRPEIDPITLQKMYSDLNSVTLLTYDDVLDRAKRRFARI